MRVLFVTRKWPPAVGGMELYSQELARNLSDLVSLDVLALPGRTDGSPPRPIALLKFILSTALALARRARHYDVIHFGDMVLFPLAWWAHLLSARPQLLVTVHGLDLVYGRRRGWKPWLYRLFLSWARGRGCIDHFIANSRHTARLAGEGGFQPVTAVPLAASVASASGPRPSETRYILFVGRLVPRKGARWFAENVLPRLPEDVELRVVGKAWDRGEAEALARAPRTRILGYVGDAELAALRAGARAQIMPNVPSPDGTDVEGFGIAAVEAAAAGAPVLAADLEGLSDAVKDGETGFLLLPADADAWTAKIMDVIAWDEDRRQTFAATARNCVMRHYSWRRVAEQTIGIYRDCLRQAGKAA